MLSGRRCIDKIEKVGNQSFMKIYDAFLNYLSPRKRGPGA